MAPETMCETLCLLLCKVKKRCQTQRGVKWCAHIYEGGDVLEVVLIHGGVGCSQVQEVIVSSLAALQVDFLDLTLSLQNKKNPPWIKGELVIVHKHTRHIIPHKRAFIYFFYQPPQFLCSALFLLFFLFLCLLQLPLCTHVFRVVLVVCPPCLHTDTYSHAFLFLFGWLTESFFSVASFTLTVCNSVVTLSSPSCSWVQTSLLWKQKTTRWDGTAQKEHSEPQSMS